MATTPGNFKKFKKGPLVLALVVLILAVGAFVFVYGRIQANQKIIAAARERSEEEAQRQQELRALENLLGSVESKRQELQRHFVEASNVVPFLNDLEELARRAGAEPQVEDVELGQDVSALSSGLSAQIKARGTFEAVYKFLLLLENSPYELEVLSLDLSNDGQEWQGEFIVKLLSFIP
jgi:hypothetical protein